MRQICLLIALALVMPFAAHAELEATLVIKGDPAELLQVLQFIQQKQGGGEQPGAESTRLEMHSVQEAAPGQPGAVTPDTEADVTPEGAPPAPAVPEPQPSALGIEDVRVEPASAGAGETVRVFANVKDAEGKVDTVGVKVLDTPVMGDLFDRGDRGDASAGDGAWTGTLELPADLASGAYTVRVSAYDPFGAPLTAGDAQQPGGEVRVEGTTEVQVQAQQAEEAQPQQEGQEAPDQPEQEQQQ